MWKLVTISDIAHVQGGRRLPKGHKLQNHVTEYPYISVRDFTEDGTVDATTVKYLAKETYSQIKRYTISKDDVFISIAGTIGKTGIIPDILDGANLTENACKLVLKEGVDKRYIYYFTKSDSFIEQAVANTRVAAQPKLALERLKAISLRVPPLQNQQTLVAILDQAFEGIDAAIANTQANLAAARELFESHLNKSFECKLKNSSELTLGQICDFENGDRGKNYPNKSEYVSDGVPWINTGHINPDGSLAQDRMSYITETKFKSLGSGKIREGDLVYCLRGATIGKTAIVDPFTKGAIASSLMIIRPRNINRHFLYFYLISKHGKSEIRKYQNGAAQPNLGAKSVKQYSIRVPSAKEQKEVVARIQSLSAQIAKLENSYGAKLNALHELKQSILAKAFRGELTQEEIAA